MFLTLKIPARLNFVVLCFGVLALVLLCLAVAPASAFETITFSSSDGLETVEKTTELRPDLLIMDVQLPQLSGPKATR